MEEFTQEEAIHEILREIYELKRTLNAMGKSLEAVSKRLEEKPQQQAQPPQIDLEVALSRLREVVDKVDALAAKAVEELALQRSLLLDELKRREASCEALLERISALQGELEKLRK